METLGSLELVPIECFYRYCRAKVSTILVHVTSKRSATRIAEKLSLGSEGSEYQGIGFRFPVAT